MRRRFALVFNSKAGHAVPRLLDGVLDIVRQSGAQVFQLPARNAAEAAERVSEAAQQGGCDAVIAAGGDGTFRAVATGAAGSGLAVGVIPLGTGKGRVRRMPSGKLEIIVDAEIPIDEWLKGLPDLIRAAQSA